MEIDPPLTNGSPTPTGNAASADATGAPAASKMAQLTESLKLEHQFLRVPFEHYKKSIRANHRVVEKEVSAVVSGVCDVADSAEVSPDESVDRLTSLVSRLQGLKRKLEEGSRTEHLQAQRCRARLDHLESADSLNLLEWNNTRLKRILVDYMLRMSYYDTAVKLAESSSIQDLVDLDVFQEAKRVIDALQNKEVGPALAWCAENKSRLKKSKSIFEFQLRLQEFIELVRAENNMRAIAYARKYLAPWGATHMKELQRVMATLAFKSNTECATYKLDGGAEIKFFEGGELCDIVTKMIAPRRTQYRKKVSGSWQCHYHTPSSISRSLYAISRRSLWTQRILRWCCPMVTSTAPRLLKRWQKRMVVRSLVLGQVGYATTQIWLKHISRSLLPWHCLQPSLHAAFSPWCTYAQNFIFSGVMVSYINSQ